jgi:hypothetical protein
MKGFCLADYAVQIGAFKNHLYAKQTADALEKSGLRVIQFRGGVDATQGLLRILTGPYATHMEAENARGMLADQGFRGFVRSIEDNPDVKKNSNARSESVTLERTLAPEPEAARANVFLSNYFAAPEPFEISKTPEPASPSTLPFSLSGYVQSEAAYTFAAPDHWSKFRNTFELAAQKKLTSQINLKISGRFSYDAIYDITTFFPDRVKRDQRFDAMFRETYLDVGAGDWDFRVGRQQIIWGEVVGLFFADVVSAKDLREWIIPDLDYLRIPQWAARAEYFKDDFHAEAILVPYMTYDRIGKPGSDYFPFPPVPPPGFALNIRNERIAHRGLSDVAVGVRLGYLLRGWDLTGFYYDSVDSSPAFFRQLISAPPATVVYTPDHDRIHQLGGTLSKDFQSFVVRAEAVYTWDRWFNVTRLSDSDGVVRQNFLDYIVGVDFPLPSDSRLNLQFFQRWFPSHNPDIIPRRVESGITLFASAKILDDKVEPDLLVIHSLNRLDWMVRPRITWRFHPDWRFRIGTALFGGNNQGLSGRFDNRDRAFVELRYAF